MTVHPTLERLWKDTDQRVSRLGLTVFGPLMPANERTFYLGVMGILAIGFATAFIVGIIQAILREGFFEWLGLATFGIILTAGLVGLIMWLSRRDEPLGEPVTSEEFDRRIIEYRKAHPRRGPAWMSHLWLPRRIPRHGNRR